MKFQKIPGIEPTHFHKINVIIFTFFDATLRNNHFLVLQVQSSNQTLKLLKCLKFLGLKKSKQVTEGRVKKLKIKVESFFWKKLSTS